ncbi:hypothetical protein CVT26_004015 [Gymnopilus dilepis]|uniref:F-box domain-containing protein n=1 Tax=Gymnopilus dilepis TaxID=231916 RepID=A0A409W220_9AGAR|nr:hypothetical protein CVT26_004015 [Gymnopilus dilepis]
MQATASQHESGPSKHSQPRRSTSHYRPSRDSRKPFDSLPVEVVSIVFKHYVHSVSQKSQRPYRSPLGLGKVCRRWRQIAWATPDLWTKLRIRRQDPVSMLYAELADEWLSRSRTLSLWIGFEFHCVRQDKYNRSVGQRMLEIFGRYSDRWYSLSLTVPDFILVNFRPTPSPSPVLHTISLKGNPNHGVGSPYHVSIPTFAEFSPKIVNVSFLQLDLDWTFVTVLEICRVDIAEVSRILPLATNLSKCTLRKVGSLNRALNPTITKISCPSLESLDIDFSDLESQSLFCCTGSLPALKRLTFKGCREQSTDMLIALLTQSSCTLKCLVFFEPWQDTFALSHLAPLLSSLTELNVFSDHSSYSAIDIYSSYHILANQSSISPIGLTATWPKFLLPSLEIFKWFGKGHSYPWETLPGLIMPVSLDGEIYRRPLKLVQISFDDAAAVNVPHISKGTIQQLSEFTDVTFEFTVNYYLSEQKMDWWKVSLEESQKLR